MKPFDIITEADARQLAVGSVVELAPGGHVTPLAQDTLRARRVTVVPAGSSDPSLPADLAPMADIRRLAIGSDHTGVELMRGVLDHLRRKGLAVEERGSAWGWHDPKGHDPSGSSASSRSSLDYPDVAAAVGLAVARGEADAGIVIDGAGLGSTIAANKIRGVRATMCTNVTLARYAREHTGANILALGATLVTIDEAREIVDTWLATPMREARYIRRLLKIRRLESSDSR
ncbi:MAG: RpiB/LacA/LacB family sugar-phosphate isomerase [Vicinamibacterales bacterium]